MKPNTFFLTLLLLCFTTVQAQHHGRENQPKITPQGKRFSPQEYIKHQEAFIIREAELSPAEAANFFPLFHSMNNELRKTDRSSRQLLRKARTEKLEEKQYQEILQRMDQLEAEKVNTTTEYHKKFLKVLDSQKVIRVIDSSRRFERTMLRRVMERSHK